ncbi:Efflux pump atB [Lachnellula suecica]|uniref:Efflux pump atB n=1 Tax=Lachnellula suecica TaxID=602035 RepID=A0A8T9C347_9HELO|nr:Efflux pump atB [Lachnellula suecica]
MAANDRPNEPGPNPSDSETTTESFAGDEEKRQPPTLGEAFLVEWDGDSDPLNPRSFSLVRKWLYVFIVAAGSLLVTCTSSLYASCYEQLMAEFHCSQEVATLGLSIFVIGIAIGPMIMSPLSEFFGRRPIYLPSMLFFLIWLIPCAVAQNIETLLVARFFNGLAGSAFLSVAGATVGDLFSPGQMQAPMMLFTIGPFLGPVLGPLIGGFINQFAYWRWSFYVLLIWTGIILICLLFVPETYHPVLLHKKAAALRKSTGNSAYHSLSEDARASKSLSQALVVSLYRPFQLLFLDPMVLSLCLYTAVILGILYLFFGAFPLVFHNNHDFVLWQTGLTFIGLTVGMFIGCLLNPFWNRNYVHLVNGQREKNGGKSFKPDPEFRLPPAIAGAPLIPIGLFWFGWTSYRSVHWIVPIIGSVFFGAGNFMVFSGIWTFLVDAYPTYAASALAANAFARCMFAAAFPLFGNQMYNKLGYQWASSLLAFLTLAMMPFPYLFFRYGKTLRARSKFASG